MSTTIPGYYTVAEAAAYLKCDPSTVSRYIRDGKLKAADLGAQAVILAGDLESFTPPVPGNPEFLRKSKETSAS